MKRIIPITLHVLIAAAIVAALWWVSQRRPELTEFCANKSVPVHTMPLLESQIFEVLSKDTSVWWDGTKSNKWIFVSFKNGFGWVETAPLGFCRPDSELPVIEQSG